MQMFKISFIIHHFKQEMVFNVINALKVRLCLIFFIILTPFSPESLAQVKTDKRPFNSEKQIPVIQLGLKTGLNFPK